jgi:hypothetical protein
MEEGRVCEYAATSPFRNISCDNWIHLLKEAALNYYYDGFTHESEE